MADRSGVGVELSALDQFDQIPTTLGIEQENPLAGLEGPAHACTRLSRGAFDQFAKGAQFAGRRRPAPGAGMQSGPLLLGVGRHQGGHPIQEPEVEGRLRSGRGDFDAVERLLVAEVPVAGGHRAFLHDVVDAAQHAVRGHLPLAQTDQRLDLAGEPVALRQDRILAPHVGQVPPQHVPEQHGRLVIEIVPGGHHVIVAIQGGLVEQMPFRQTARRARRPAGRLRSRRDIEAELAPEVDLHQTGLP